jgi:hypothetical protein
MSIRGECKSYVRLLGSLQAVLLLLIAALGSVDAATTPKFFQTVLIRVGGSSLVSGDEVRIAKYDMAVLNRFHDGDVGGQVWRVIRSLNPNTQIYLYEMGMWTTTGKDDKDVYYLNDLGRYNVSRGHSMGALNVDHPELFLLDRSGNRIIDPGYSTPPANYSYLMDFGSSDYWLYWVEAVRNDIVAQSWAADGIFVDGCFPIRGRFNPQKYNSDDKWIAAMNSFSSAITRGLHRYHQKTFLNRGLTGTPKGREAWTSLDASNAPPDVVLEEGAFAVMWGNAAVQFLNEAEWRRQIDLMAQIHNSKLAYLSHTKLKEGQTGTDNYGAAVGFWDILWYSMASYLIGKNTVDSNSYFSFTNSYNTVPWYEELGRIDLGRPVGKYKTVAYGTSTIYWREFDKGYVYVNPTSHNVTSIALPETCKRLTHDSFKMSWAGIPDIISLSLAAHRGAILSKKP